jgi:hypothetical protein
MDLAATSRSWYSHTPSTTSQHVQGAISKDLRRRLSLWICVLHMDQRTMVYQSHRHYAAEERGQTQKEHTLNRDKLGSAYRRKRWPVGHIAGRRSSSLTGCHGLELMTSKDIMLLHCLRANLYSSWVPSMEHHYTHCKSLK